jgi:TetR/AcrR family transcriptional regulator, mexJK operon transcriptional repressor
MATSQDQAAGHLEPAESAPAAEGPADRKRRAILGAASVVFLREGYAGASMDEITALAGASKATVYRYFTDKQTLFSELVATTVTAVSDPVQAEVQRLGDGGSLEAGLRDLARRLLTAITAPELLGLRRLIIGEAGRFPALGQAFYEQGPARTIAALAGMLTRLAAEGLLKIDDPLAAAGQLNWLIAAEPLNRAMLLGDNQPFTPAELTAHADAAVTTFLAAYRS